MALSDRLKEARLAAGMTQQQVSDSLEIAKSSISSYENGTREPPPYTIAQLMKLFDVDANFLFQDFSTERKANELTDGEAELIACYRQISPSNQIRLTKVAHYLVESEEIEALIEKAEENQDETKKEA